MKTAFLLFLILFITDSVSSAQTLNYQGVARNAAGAPLANTSITIRLSIKDAQENGNSLYTETKNVMTNGFGLYNVSINDGTGTRTDDFTAIDWSQQRFIQTEMDPENGSAFTDLGTVPMYSVPQALSAVTLNGIPQPKEGYFIEYVDGQWVQKPKPLKKSASGAGLRPVSTLGFIGPTLSFTFREDHPTISIVSTKTVGTTHDTGARTLNLNVGYRKAGESTIHVVQLIGIVNINIPDNTRIPVTVSYHVKNDALFKKGETYEFGMTGIIAANSDRWNDNGTGFISGEESY